MTATRQLKQQVTELLMNDKSIIESMAEVVSSLIIEKLSNSEEIFATKIMNNSEFVKSVTSNFEGHTGAIKQELYESLSFDDHEIKDRLMKIEEYSGEMTKLKVWNGKSIVLSNTADETAYSFTGFQNPPNQ